MFLQKRLEELFQQVRQLENLSEEEKEELIKQSMLMGQIMANSYFQEKERIEQLQKSEKIPL
jgi:hypothetical protein